MKLIIFISLIFFLSNCSKPRTAFICGDHVCVNKAEADQFFEENLSIEVKIIDNKNNDKEDLVELNLKDNSLAKKEISISSKKSTNKPIKTLSNKEVVKIKKKIKNKKKEKKIAKKLIKKEDQTLKKVSKQKKPNDIEKKIFKNDVNKKRKDMVDVCTILEKCSIDEISKYLLKQGKNKKFPDITTRQ